MYKLDSIKIGPLHSHVTFKCNLNTQFLGKLVSRLWRLLRARRALSIFKDVPLRTRRALSLYKVHLHSALLVLNGTSLNSDGALLSSSYIIYINFISFPYINLMPWFEFISFWVFTMIHIIRRVLYCLMRI